MKTKEIEALESYFKTENEHWNEYSFETLRKAMELQLFTDLFALMELYEHGITVASDTHREKPFEGVTLFLKEVEKKNWSIPQRIYLLEQVNAYLRQTDFDGWFAEQFQELTKSHIHILKGELLKQPENFKPLTGNIRESLKAILYKELEQLPDTLKELEPAQKLNILCKLIPYVLPKVVSVTHELGEPDEFKIKTWH